jgi:Holliday junction resolvase
MKNEIRIIKASGESALFSEQKLRASLRRSGAYEDTIKEVVRDIRGQLKDGMTTKKIYQLAFKILRKKNKPAASKYKLKKAIMELGPSGFPFEKYLSEILKAQGHSVQLNLTMTGRCVTHEVDILAEKDGVQKIIECKYHNLQATICDVKISLYVNSRFKDISENLSSKMTKEGWIVTNTRFSVDAIEYANCSHLKLLGWD